MKISKLSFAPILFALANPMSVFALEPVTTTQACTGWACWLPTSGATEGTTIPSIIQTVLNFAIGFAVVVCVAILIFAGYSYMTANGDENKISQATKSLTWAIIGLVVCFIAIILVKFVGGKILGDGVVQGV